MNLYSLLHEFLALFYVFIIYDWSCSHQTQVRCVEPVSDRLLLLDWAVDTSVLMPARVGVQSNSRRTCLSTDLAWVACGAPDSCCLPLFSVGFQSSNAV